MIGLLSKLVLSKSVFQLCIFGTDVRLEFVTTSVSMWLFVKPLLLLNKCASLSQPPYVMSLWQRVMRLSEANLRAVLSKPGWDEKRGSGVMSLFSSIFDTIMTEERSCPWSCESSQPPTRGSSKTYWIDSESTQFYKAQRKSWIMMLQTVTITQKHEGLNHS